MTNTKISLEKLASIPSISMIEPNKQQNKVGFYWNKTLRQEFYILNPETLEYNQITNGELPKVIRAGYIWLHDGIHITYTKDKDGDENHDMYLYNTETKQSNQLTNTPKAQEYPSTMNPDGKQLLFGSTRNGQLNLFKLHLDTREIKQVTTHDKPVWITSAWSKNGWIYYNYNETFNLKNNDIWAIKEDGTDCKKIYSRSNESTETFIDLNNEGTKLAFYSDYSGIDQTGILDIKSGDVKWLGSGKYEEVPVKFSHDGQKLIVLQNNDAEIKPIIYDVESGNGKMLNFRGVTSFVRFCLEDKYLVYLREDPKSPMMLARYNLDTDEEEIIIPPQTDLAAEDFLDQDYIKYPSFDGLMIPAILYKPKLEPGKKYPALVNVHGGPTYQYFQLFDMFSQIFAHNGFVIINPNIRGSTGYGKEFKEMNLKDWGGADGKDIVWAKKYLESLDYVDPNRIGVFGGSYGGFATFLQLTKYADAGWNAGSAWIGISNLKTFYDRSQPHFKTIIIQYLGKYEENQELWEDRSAMTHISKLKVPIQMIHGANDPRCPVEESRQFKDKLLDMGWKDAKTGDNSFEYIEFTDEGHSGFSDIGMRIRTFKHFIDFFKRRL